MAEKRLIDANAIYDAVERRYQMSSGIEHRCERDLLDLICSAETVDAVEVVRCKDCEFGGSCVLLHKSDSQVCNIFTHKKDYVEVVRCKDCEFCVYNSSNDTYKCRSMNGMYRRVEPDEFCSYGERREGE